MSDKKETTNLDVLDVLYRALQTQKQVMLDHKHKADGKFDEEIEDVEYDGHYEKNGWEVLLVHSS